MALLPEDIDIAPSDMPAASAGVTSPDPNSAAPPVPPRRNVPPPPAQLNVAGLNLDDPDEVIKPRSPHLGGAPAPPPRPPRRFTPSASPRVSDEVPRSSSAGEDLLIPPAPVHQAPVDSKANPFADEKAVL
jgi:hypothetical protein